MTTERHTASRHASQIFLLSLLLFGGLGVWYSLAVPPFEAPDEVFHYAFARHLAAGHGLPVQNADVEGPWEQEGSQAPLYYLLTGWLTAGVDQGDFPQISVRNPRANIGDPLFPGNKNFMLYSAVDWPLSGANLALHLGRWFSLLLGALTLVCTYLTAQLAFAPAARTTPLTLPLMTLLLVATLPQFVFLSAAFSNDNLINAASAAVVYWLARLITHSQPAGRPIRWWEWLILGVLLGIAALSKLQGLGLFLLSALSGLWIAWVRRDWRLPLAALLPVALPALIIAGWWYWRNYTLYGDWLGISHLLANNGRRDDPLTWLGFWREFRGLRYSFWGLFGWFNLLLPQWIYTVLDALTVLALAGVLIRIGEQRGSRVQAQRLSAQAVVRLLLLAWSGLSVALLLYWTSQATGSQGRLLFPGLSALATLFVWALDVWVRQLPIRFQPLAWLALPALLIAASLYTLLVLFPASYRAPAPLAALPNDVTHTDVIYGDRDQLRLLALAIPDRRYKVGETAPVTLYLQAPAAVRADYQLFIQFLDETGREVGNLTSHPAWGRNPTTLWQPGAIYADSYPVLITGPVAAWSPLLARVYIGFVDPKTEKSGRFPIPARTGAGVEITPFVSQIAISPAQPPQPVGLTPNGVQFGSVIQLSGVAVPASPTTTSTLTVTLQWDALATPAAEYTAFVQLRNEAGERVAGYDQAPAGARFPTPHWRTGDRIVQTVALPLSTALPSGQYTVWAGLYETASQGALRLPITASAQQTTGDGEVLLGAVALQAAR